MVKSIKNLIAAILISVSGYLFWTNVLPKYDNSSELKLTIEEKTALLDSRNSIFKRIQDLEGEYEKRYAELKRFSSVVPENKLLPEMITTMEDISSRTGVVIPELNIGSGGSVVGGSFDILSLDTNFETSYDSLLNFLDYLEKNIRLIDVTSLSISKGTSVGGQAGSLSVSIKARAYSLKPLSEIEASKKPASAVKEE